MKLLTFLLFFASFFQCLRVNAQGDSFKEFVDGDFSVTILQDDSVRDSLIKWQEKIAVQLDKKVVVPKDVLFFKANILTGPERFRVSASEVLKVELLDKAGKLIKGQNHKINAGQAYGSFEIPKRLKHGTYFFRAYTQWMLNYGTEILAVQEISVGDSDKNFTKDKIEFYPEGGSLVAGLENKLIMRIEGYTTDDLRIVNAQNESVSSVVKFAKNVFSALFTPEKGSRYFLEFNDEFKRPLPSIQDSGYTLQVNTIEDDFFDLRIQASPELQKEKLYVVGESNGVQYLKTEVDFKESSSINLQISKKELLDGIFDLTLFNELDEVLGERKLHLDNSALQVSIEPIEKESQGAMKSFSIKVMDNQGQPVATELSVSLKNYKSALESITYGTVNNRKERYINDLLLLTHQLPTIFETINIEDLPDRIYYDFQNGLEFYGQAYDLDNKLIANNTVQILIKTDEDNIVKEVRTDSNGMLKVSGLQLEGESTMVFRRVAEDTKSKLVRVNPYKYKTPPLKIPLENEATGSPNSQNEALVSPKTVTKEFSTLEWEKGTINLEGVTLIEKKTKMISNPSVYGVEPTRTVYQDMERPKTLPQLFIGLPGFQVTNMGGLNPTLIRPASMGIGPMLWVIDGFPLPQSSPRSFAGSPVSKLTEVMDMISYIDIERIEILGGANAAIYGSRAAGGVILIYTRTGNTKDYYARKDAQSTFQGYHKSLDFDEYQQSYDVNKRKGQLPQTLYWNPVLKTDENGEAIINIELPSEANKIKFEALTITPEGRMGKATRIF